MSTPDIAPSTAAPVARLIEAFHRLPGIGPKTAQRLTYHLIRMPREQAEELAESILSIKDRIVLCGRCQNVTETPVCAICSDLRRDSTRICAVEEPLDVVSIERTRAFRGQYHVLHGVISPSNGIGPEELKVRELLERLRDGTVQEIIVATNPNLEGEATAMYLQRLISPLGVKVTRLARGLPAGADLEYADDATLAHALEARSEFKTGQ
ncbi:MAG: recombination protein RecR [Dehalococcoidia bacterium]|nr:recombination protein RecR [Dehalococcoidia bacterium]MSQ34992.1 recombination protein RecR [Dehalococcoidia bacterium]